MGNNMKYAYGLRQMAPIMWAKHQGQRLWIAIIAFRLIMEAVVSKYGAKGTSLRTEKPAVSKIRLYSLGQNTYSKKGASGIRPVSLRIIRLQTM